MTSNKVRNIQQMVYNHLLVDHSRTRLPDYLTKFIDDIIRKDHYQVLRYDFLHYNLDELIQHQQIMESPTFLYIDAYADDNIFSQSPSQTLQLSKSKASSVLKTLQKLSGRQKELQGKLTRSPNSKLALHINQNTLQLLKQQTINNIDLIRLKCVANMYCQPEQLIKDLKKLIGWNQIYRTYSLQSYVYLNMLYYYIINQIDHRKFIKNFYETKQKDFQNILQELVMYKMPNNQWPYIPDKFREYEKIDDYVPTPQSRKQIILKHLQSQKVPIDCPSDCVCFIPIEEQYPNRQFCRYTLKDGWVSECVNRSQRVECNHACEQKMKKCRNSQIKKGQRKKCKSYEDQVGDNFEIEECLSWGIDLYTRTIIFKSLPEIDIVGNKQVENSEEKNKFIQLSLLRAINFNGKLGYDISKACQFIIDNEGKMFSNKDKLYAECLLGNYLACTDPTAYRIHTKGKGAKCINKTGIKQSSFIVQYYGQLYEPWRWYEKEDLIKSLLKQNIAKDIVPQFYNIYLEKHKDQPGGYDIMVVDPIRMGNFSSRFSHSCNPNCGTVMTVSDGKYHIGMYSFRDIQYGEELSFDYCSFTEAKNQHQNSICLCGMRQCRGNYLQLDNSRVTSFIDKSNCFLLRNSLILRSMSGFTEEDRLICYKYNIRQSNLKEIPQWMKKWVSLVLQFMEKESEDYKEYFKNKWRKNYPWNVLDSQQTKEKNIQQYSQLSRQQFFTLRFQNLFNTLDKIKYFVLSVKDNQVPLTLLSNNEVLRVLVTNPDSVVVQMLQALRQYNQEVLVIQKFSQQIHNYSQQPEYALFLFRIFCLHLSNRVCGFEATKEFTNKVFSDIVYFYAFTHTYFTSHQYKTHVSQEVEVCMADILGRSTDKKSKIDKKSKKYSSQFVWGQLAAWFKQTIVNPEASLSQDRRGTLSQPTISSTVQLYFYHSKSDYPFQKNSRNSFLNSIKQKPYSSWPTAAGCTLSFKNKYKCYGTIVFEDFYNRSKFVSLKGGSLLNTAIEIIDSSFEEKLQLLKKVEAIFNNTSADSPAYQLIKKMFDEAPHSIPQRKGIKKRKIQI